MSRLALFSGLLCYFVGSAIALDLPSFITPCRAKDPNISECVLKEGNKVMAIIANGVPEVGLPNLVTYKYPEIVYNGTEVNIKYHGGTAIGLAQLVFSRLNYEIEKNRSENTMKIPKLELDGTYEIDGKLFDTQIKAAGPFKITLENVDLHFKLQYELYDKEGDDYVRLLTQTVRLEPETIKVNFEHLFHDAEKTEKFNHQINENHKRAMKEIVPSVGVLFKNYIANHVFGTLVERIPFNKFILPD